MIETGPRIYYLHPLLAGPLRGWEPHLTRAAAMGFGQVLVAPPFAPARDGSVLLSASHAALHPALGWDGDAASGLAAMVEMAGRHGLALMLDVVVDRVAADGALARAGGPFTREEQTLDPRLFDPEGDAAHAEDALALAAFWVARMGEWAGCGVAGVRLRELAGCAPRVVRAVADGLGGRMTLCGDLAGVPIDGIAAYAGCGLDYVFGSLPWWDGRGDWVWREAAALARVAPLVAASEAPFGARLYEHLHDVGLRMARLRGMLAASATMGAGWMMVMGQEFGAVGRLHQRREEPDAFAEMAAAAPADLGAVAAALNAARTAHGVLSSAHAASVLSAPGAALLTMLRMREADARLPGEAVLVGVNLLGSADAVLEPVQPGAGGYLRGETAPVALPPGGFAVMELVWKDGRGAEPKGLGKRARHAAGRWPRIAIEAVTPSVDGGRFPVRVCVGEAVAVAADILCDGHEKLGAELRWQAPGDAAGEWRRVPMVKLGNDRWEASFTPERLGVHRYTVEAWKDEFATYRYELDKKTEAGIDVTLEAEEGRRLVARYAQAAAERADVRADEAAVLVRVLGEVTHDETVETLLAEETLTLMAAIEPRLSSTWVEPALPLEAERTAARFASWYEIFPRSMSGDGVRHGTFDDVIDQLPRIRAMGFDVLYFPPIHPIGRVNRKGRNNTLTPAQDDPGSPYGIADHVALHEELGTFADFARLRDAAFAHGMELALDFAIQCAPDHPWLREHPGWFDWRPDGTIRYAENPPKKYQDIVNVDFYRPDAVDGLWRTLCEVVLFWCGHGVRIFRVDNPHTKPLPFWQWMIGEVRLRFPDTLFLAEAFTAPKMMNRLAKVGFSQSYTYFTWRNTRAELEEYLVELTTGPARDFFRPNFFVNTPDINPVFLQTTGRPGHLIRAALAATLAGLWGVYGGFELCEAAPLPGREEYIDSEKYQLRAWDWERPGNIVAEISQLNAIRRANPALQTHLGITFLHSGNDQILYFEKATPDRDNVVLVAINLDPHSVQEGWYEVPLWRWSLADNDAVAVDDLVSGHSTVWRGKMQHVRLDPDGNPYAIWRVRPV